jgi:hypothetical protein
MKKIKSIKIVIVSLLMCLCNLLPIQAQQIELPLNPPKHSINFSVGAWPLIGIWAAPGTTLMDLPVHLMEHRDRGGYGDYSWNSYLSPSLTFQYHYHFNSKHAIGASTTWAFRHITENDGAAYKKGNEHYLAPQFSYRYTYYQKNNLALYLTVNVGLTFYIQDKILMTKNQKDNFWIMTNIHVNPIGISIGNKHAFCAELGFGTQGTLKIGYMYKFNNRSCLKLTGFLD